jgi:hypothetical protein
LEDKKITPDVSWLGVDADESGEVDMDKLSPEAARADSETIVFRIGQTYLSTKKADVAKNQIMCANIRQKITNARNSPSDESCQIFRLLIWTAKSAGFPTFAANTCCSISGFFGVRRV